ncbi:MAG TPA: AMP-binding protein [Actinomycetota bacterium]|nr:AMP-binding protein [Actinomycetota bacterium]
MRRRPGGLGTIAALAAPRSLSVLRRAGVMDPPQIAALLSAAPWLAGRGPSMGILSHVNGRAVGAKPAIHDAGGTLTWRDLDRRTNRLARAFDRLGIGPRDSVAAVLRNGREFVEVLVAAQKAGIAVAPLNTWATEAELRAAVESARPRLIVADHRHAESARRAAGDVPVVTTGADPGAGDPLEELFSAEADRPLFPVARRGGARIVIHTSGTTGWPKGAARDAARQGPGGLIRLLEVLPLHRRDVILIPAPLFHSFGLLALTFGMLLGATVVLPDRFDAEETLDLIEQRGVTACALVPVMLGRILGLPGRALADRDLGTLRMVLSGGSALDGPTRTRATALFGPVVYDLYGSTEAGWISVATPRDLVDRPGSVGRPIPGVEVTVVGRDGSPVGRGQVGEIVIRGEGVFDGYLDAPSDGRVATGDLGRLDAEGFLWVDGRVDDLMVIGGENVRPIEIEEVVARVDGVEEVAAAGIPDDEYGQVPAVFVVGRASEEAILEACRSRLARYKVPRRILRRAELPRTATGKVLKGRLVGDVGKE